MDMASKLFTFTLHLHYTSKRGGHRPRKANEEAYLAVLVSPSVDLVRQMSRSLHHIEVQRWPF